MQTKSQASTIHLTRFFMSFLLDILYFPLWWYGSGLKYFFVSLLQYLNNSWISLGISIWIRNIFVPMYGMRDIGSFFISFFLRLIQVIFRLIFFIFVIFSACIFASLWVLLPPFLWYLFIMQFS